MATPLLHHAKGHDPFDLFGGDSGSLLPFQYRWSPPTRFGEKYKNDLSNSAKTQAFLMQTW